MTDHEHAHEDHRTRLRARLTTELVQIGSLMDVTASPDDLGVYDLIEARSALQDRLASVDATLLALSRSRLAEERGDPPGDE